MIHYVKKLANGFGILRSKHRRLDRPDSYPKDLDPAVVETIIQVRHYTQTFPERIAALCEAVKYITRYDIPTRLWNAESGAVEA